MPPFNPQVPDVNAANTAFWARPVGPIRPDLSKETLYKGIGKGFDEAVSGVDDFIKHGVIQPIEEKDLGTHHDEFVDALNTATSYVQQGQGYTSGDKPSLLPSGENVPTAVAQAGDRIQTLHDSMIGGHLSESKYYSDIDNYLRRLRTMFPGFRDFIDEEAHRITGVNVANQEIRSRIGDLNRLMSESGEKKHEMENLLDWASREHILPPEVYNDYQQRWRADPGNTSLIDKLRSDINQRGQFIFTDKQNEAAYKQQQHDKATADEKGKVGMNTHFSQERDLALEHMAIASGFYKGANLRSWLDDLDQGVIDRNDPNVTQAIVTASTQLDGLAAQMKSAWTNYAMRAYPGYGGTGDSSVESMIKANVQPIVDMAEHLRKGDLSQFAVTADMTKGMKADREHTLEQKYGEQASILRYIKEIGAESFIPKSMYAPVGEFLEKVYKTDWGKAVAQPGLLPGGDGTVMTLNKAMEDWKSKGATKENYDQLFQWRDMMLDPKAPPELKANLAKFFYSVDNWGIFRKYGDNKTFADEPAIYSRLFNELVSKNLSKLPSENYQMYRGAAEAEGGTLFGRDMDTLRGFERGGAGDVRFLWHTEPMMMKNGKMGMLETVGARVPDTLQKAVDNLNASFMGIKSVYDHDPTHKGTPVEEYVAYMMMEHGINPNNPNIQGLPELIAKSVQVGHKAPITPGEETGKVKTLEEK